MTQQAYAATALQRAAGLTNIQKGDGELVAASKFVGGLPLKISVAVFAAFEFVVRTAILIAASPLYFLANKTFTEMTEATKSSAQTIVNATVSLATIRAPKKEEPAAPAPKTIRDHLNDAVAYARDKGNAALATVQKKSRHNCCSCSWFNCNHCPLLQLSNDPRLFPRSLKPA